MTHDAATAIERIVAAIPPDPMEAVTLHGMGLLAGLVLIGALVIARAAIRRRI